MAKEIDRGEIPFHMQTIGVLAGLAAPQATHDFESHLHIVSKMFVPPHFTTGYPPMIVIHFREVPFKMKDRSFVFPVEPNPNLLKTAKSLGGTL